MIKRMFSRVMKLIGMTEAEKSGRPAKPAAPQAGSTPRLPRTETSARSGQERGHADHRRRPAAPAEDGHAHAAPPSRSGSHEGRGRSGAPARSSRPDDEAAPAHAPRPDGEEAPPRRSAAPHRSSSRPSDDRRSRPGDDRRSRGSDDRRRQGPIPRPRHYASDEEGFVAAETAPGLPPVTGEPWDPAMYQVPTAEGKTRFADLALRPELLHAVADLKFQYCTDIQALALPHSLAGKDVAGKAQTGTGKTAAFLLAVFQHILNNPVPAGRKPGTARALVLAPTRELVVQIGRDADALGRHTPIRSLAVFGGLGYDAQERFIRNGVDVVAATPGRLIDFIRKGTLDISQVEILVIDEADRMLDMGFIPDVRRIVARTPPAGKRQAMLFSATLSGEIMQLASQWMKTPVTVESEPEHVEGATIEQVVYLCTSREKLPLLVNMLHDPKFARVLIFANRRDSTTRLTERLQRDGINCDMLSGDVPQNKRMRILDAFKSGELRVLVATDVAGRGLHIHGVTHVVNFDVPVEPEDYVHRIGRTGRAGAVGNAITFACEKESFTLPDIEKLLGHSLTYRQPDEAMLKSGPRPPPAAHPRAAEADAAPAATPHPHAPAHHAAGHAHSAPAAPAPDQEAPAEAE